VGFSFKLPATTQKKLEKLGLRCDEDLLLHLPLRWEDETRLTPIRDLLPGQSAVIQATVERAEILYRPRRQLLATVADASGQLVIRFIHFYPSLARLLEPGELLRFSGEVRGGFFGLEMIHPRSQRVAETSPLPERLTPVYPTTAGLGQHTLRKYIQLALASADLSETLPADVYADLALPDFASSLLLIHQPEPHLTVQTLDAHDHAAFRRLAFDELLAQQFSLRLARAARANRQAMPLPGSGRLVDGLLEQLPFKLTRAQHKAWHEISQELASPHPMRRLLQGDVGSGKTIVAALACLQAIENDRQAALMAPTEILAEQHFQKLREWLQPLGIEMAWLASALSPTVKKAALAKLESGQAQLAVGTHA
jgi:ATP-dependent DNA helicase RecG